MLQFRLEYRCTFPIGMVFSHSILDSSRRRSSGRVRCSWYWASSSRTLQGPLGDKFEPVGGFIGYGLVTLLKVTGGRTCYFELFWRRKAATRSFWLRTPSRRSGSLSTTTGKAASKKGSHPARMAKFLRSHPNDQQVMRQTRELPRLLLPS